VRISNVQLLTRDLQRVRSFYEDILGFKSIEQEEGTLDLCAEIGQDPLITLEESTSTEDRPDGSPGLYHIAILLPARKELARQFKRLAEERYPMQGFADHGVSETIYLADPDGNGLELYVDRPAETWPRKKGGIEMYTKPLDLEDLLLELKNDSTAWDGIHPDARIGHIHLQVSDLSKSGDFYHDVLGYDITQKNFPRALFLANDGYHHHIGLNTWNSKGVLPAPKGSGGLVRFSIETLDLITLRHLQVQFLHKGIRFKEIPSENNSMPALLAADPDGIEIKIVVQQRVLVN
jgi:catechol 2,3-dioxygenase